MNIQFEKDGRKYVTDLDSGTSIAIDLDFDGLQPNHFEAQKATRQPIVVGDFVGSINRGAGCNVDTITLVPHCNGTHTESVGHIVNQSVSVVQLAKQSFFFAKLVTVDPTNDHDGNSYVPELRAEDQIVDVTQLRDAIGETKVGAVEAVIVRTTPNNKGKRSRIYGADAVPAFFSSEAMRLVVEIQAQHLLVDLPSVDRMHDDGKLSNHHLFWNVERDKSELNDNTRVAQTITEMIYVPNELQDGDYLLNLQIAPFYCDAAPARPILFPVTEIEK